MLRKVNGVLQRRGDDGIWRAVAPEDPEYQAQAQVPSQSHVAGGAGIAAEVDALRAQNQAPDEINRTDAALIHETENQLRNKSQRQAKVAMSENMAVPDGSQDSPQKQTASDMGLDIGEVPGLLHGEGPRSTAQQSRLQKLRDRARGKKAGSRITSRVHRPRDITVPASQAEVTGPDAQGSRLERSATRRSVPVKEAPSLLENRAQWIKDLFEAHFRSELAYTLRKLPSGVGGKNRMKLSRQDYAIGWLVLFDKAREDPGILRLRKAGGQ